MFNRKLVLVGGALVVSLSGCHSTEGVRDLQQFTKEAYKARKPEITPLPEVKPYERYEYSSSDEVDPFNKQNLAPPEDQLPDAGEGPDTLRRKQPLEKYPLDGLKMVGTMEKSDIRWVILSAPDNVTYHARVGDFVGQNYGKIEKIAEDKIDIVETIKNPVGRWIKRKSVLEVAEQTEGYRGNSGPAGLPGGMR